MRTLRGFLPVVSISVNSRGPFDFLVDTGSNTTLIDPALAAELGLAPADRLRITTLTGSEAVPRYFVNEIQAGNTKLGDVEVLSSPLTELQRVDKKIRGILGTNFLTAFSFRLDYEHRRLELFDAAESLEITGGTRVPVELTESRMLIRVESKAARRGTWKLALDSALAQPVVFEDRMAEDFRRNDACIGVCTMTVRTNSFRTTEAARSTADISIGKMLLRDLPMVMPADSTEETRLEDGLLPVVLFRSITFDRPGGSVVLNGR
jgi:predicted aspartyl protease